MLKQSLFYLLLSVLLVFFAKYIHIFVVYIDWLYTYFNIQLAPIFSNSELGLMFRSIIALTLLPIAITAVPALLYRAFKNKMLPYYFEITWLVWLVIALSNILIR